MKTLIIVSLQFESTHWWADCPFKEVEFLKSPHRHIFHIKCTKEVSHDDREIEIIMFKREVENHLKEKFNNGFMWMSCEMISRYLIWVFGLYSCEVLEDWENGALLIKE